LQTRFTLDGSASADADLALHPSRVNLGHESFPSTFSLGPYSDSGAQIQQFGNNELGSYVYPDNFYPSPRLLPSLPLPPQWSRHHDRAICFMDASSDCSLTSIVSNIKRSYPELAMARLTPGMIEKRLKVLDQNIYVDYWGLALNMHA